MSGSEPEDRADAPDGLVTRFLPSPNHGERPGGRSPDLLLLHYTGMPTAEDALRRLRDPAAEVSAHYVVLEAGEVIQLVPEDRRAWHAGAGSWAGDEDINSCSIGIEIVNPGHDGGLPPYPDRQIDAVIALSQAIVGHWRIPADRVLAHSDIAPARKQDPGELFPWRRLHEAGIGHWVEPAAISGGALLGPAVSGADVETLQQALRDYGYGIEPTGFYDHETELVVAAFQRHFRPARVDGLLDPSTLATLQALLAGRPEPG